MLYICTSFETLRIQPGQAVLISNDHARSLMRWVGAHWTWLVDAPDRVNEMSRFFGDQIAVHNGGRPTPELHDHVLITVHGRWYLA